jgi:serine/threonine protein kinase/formylglycine-generating enzyme required for sulfatase activity
MHDDALLAWAAQHGVSAAALACLPGAPAPPDPFATDPSAWAHGTHDDPFATGPLAAAAPADDEPAGSDPDAPPRVPGVQVLGLLGEGGMAQVWQGHDLDLRRVVAVKVLRADASPATRARFVAEAQITAQLSHPGVIPVHAVGTLPDGRPYFSMQKVSGETFQQVFERHHRTGAPTLRALIELFRRVCETVAYAHHRGVVHRDLKPNNLMLGGFGEVLVLDWGLARLLHQPEAARWTTIHTDRHDAGGDRTRAGAQSGTPRYMSPEQARGRFHEAGPPADVFSLGLVLWELLEGRPAYAATDAEALLDDIAHAPPPPLSEAHPEALRALCAAATQHDPHARPPDASHLVRGLGTWLDDAERRAAALELTARAATHLPTLASLRARATALREAGQAQLSELPSYAPLHDKAVAWAALDEAAQLDQQADALDADRTVLLEAALTRDPTTPAALDALARDHHDRHAAAEAQHQHAAAALHLRQLRRYDRGAYRAYLQGDGALTLHTDPPGAELRLHRMVEHQRCLTPRFERVLGRSPLRAAPLPMGSYLVTAHLPGHTEVRYPVQITRNHHWHGVAPGEIAPRPIRLPRTGELGPHERYVPAGWFVHGTHKPIPQCEPEARAWVEGWVFTEHVVTQQELIAFLDDLVEQDREADALRWAPRERSSRPGEPGPLCFARDDRGRFHLAPDAEGDRWDPAWPAFLVDWHAATAYAAWLAERTGQPWQLPPELAWEKAARGVDGREYPWGAHADPAFASVRGSLTGRPLPARVDQFPTDVSPYGLRGVGGNVRQWTASHAPSGERVLRGGCWFFPETGARCAHRYLLDPQNRADTVGFRVARPWPRALVGQVDRNRDERDARQG